MHLTLDAAGFLRLIYKLLFFHWKFCKLELCIGERVDACFFSYVKRKSFKWTDLAVWDVPFLHVPYVERLSRRISIYFFAFLDLRPSIWVLLANLKEKVGAVNQKGWL